MNRIKTVPLPAPTPPRSVSANTVASGQLIPPNERIKIFSAEQWEDFVLEWVDSLRAEYSRVEKWAGAGDMGCDIIAMCANPADGWDNYQCKHYRSPLSPTDIWVELGKLVYFTKREDYPYPRRYYFVAPQGAGTKLSNLLKKPSKLKACLIEAWNGHCREKITTTTTVDLDQELKDYINALDFSIFEAIPPLRIIEQHGTTRWYVYRFGGGLPERPPAEIPPANPMPSEAKYIRALLDAYADHLKRDVERIDDLSTASNLVEHFDDSRVEFYSAESLRTFSRDTLPPGEFEKLQDEIHSGIRDEIRSDHPDGYRRVVAVVRTARSLQISGLALHGKLSVRDRGGICHQLANDETIRWVQR